MGKVKKSSSSSRSKFRKLLLEALQGSSSSDSSQPSSADERSDDEEMNRPLADLIPPAVPITETENNTSLEPSNNDLLSRLRSKTAKQPIGPEIHPDVAGLITEFLHEGLDKDLRKQCTESFPLSKNCLALTPPVLNTELLSCLDPSMQRRDSFLSTP